MFDTDDDGRRLLTVAVSDEPSGIDLLAGVRKRQAARRNRIRATVATAAATVIAASTTVGLTLVQTPTALAAVTAAAARTSAQTYLSTMKFSLSRGHARSPSTFTGIFDPARGIGEEKATYVNGTSVLGRLENLTEVWRFIGSDIYASIPPSFQTGPLHGKLWVRLSPAMSRFLQQNPHGALGALLPGSPQYLIANPDDLLSALRSAGQVREVGVASGPGWTGTRYSFTAKLPATLQPRAPIWQLSGTVDVDQQGRVRAIEVTVPVKSDPALGRYRWAERIVFGDFGVAVRVTAPPASETYTGARGVFIPVG